jgi:hypothetical protein
LVLISLSAAKPTLLTTERDQVFVLAGGMSETLQASFPEQGCLQHSLETARQVNNVTQSLSFGTTADALMPVFTMAGASCACTSELSSSSAIAPVH